MISLCPAGLLDPYDYRVTPSMVLFKNWLNGAAPIVKGGSSFVDVRDVADIHAAAVEMGETGKRYLVAGENLLFDKASSSPISARPKLGGLRRIR